MFDTFVWLCYGLVFEFVTLFSGCQLGQDAIFSADRSVGSVFGDSFRCSLALLRPRWCTLPSTLKIDMGAGILSYLVFSCLTSKLSAAAPTKPTWTLTERRGGGTVKSPQLLPARALIGQPLQREKRRKPCKGLGGWWLTGTAPSSTWGGEHAAAAVTLSRPFPVPRSYSTQLHPNRALSCCRPIQYGVTLRHVTW